jgi:glycine/D-amino acid oxidase-like deaminating enzyme
MQGVLIIKSHISFTEDNPTIIIGGGFYGLRIAQFLKEDIGINNILIIEKESSVMQRASYNNQARVHNGYHYPRSVLTAIRSRVNMPIFFKEYEDAMVKDFKKYYGVAGNYSKVSAQQYFRFFQRIGAELTPSSEGLKFFNPRLIEEVFEVQEYVFNAKILKQILLKKLEEYKVVIHKNEKAITVGEENGLIRVTTDKAEYQAVHVINTTYSSINSVNLNSNLPIIPFKHELTEMCLVKVPQELENSAFTVMCGPFFSLMPFPDKQMYTLSHVRYTPHSEWYDTEEYVRDSHTYLKNLNKISHFPQMIADVKRFMPLADKIKYSGESLWEIKTILPQSESDDSRPILYKNHYGGLTNYTCIMGGKIDNIYDVLKELKGTHV